MLTVTLILIGLCLVGIFIHTIEEIYLDIRRALKNNHIQYTIVPILGWTLVVSFVVYLIAWLVWAAGAQDGQSGWADTLHYILTSPFALLYALFLVWIISVAKIYQKYTERLIKAQRSSYHGD